MPSDRDFMDCYEAMAARASLTLQQAVEMRYRCIPEEMQESGGASTTSGRMKALQKEAETIGEPEGEEGSQERESWFARVLSLSDPEYKAACRRSNVDAVLRSRQAFESSAAEDSCT